MPSPGSTGPRSASRRLPPANAQAAHYRIFRSGLLIALVSAILMFVLAIVNVAGTMLALTVARRREYAVRAALGVSRFGLLRQALAEGLFLGAVGGVLGLCFGMSGTAVLRTVVPGPLAARIPAAADAIAVDVRVGALAAGAVLLMALLCGLTAFAASGGARLESTLREASRSTAGGARYSRVRTAILAPQLALAVVLVVTTGALSVSLVRLQSVDMGLNTDRLAAVWLNLDARRYQSAPQRAAFFERAIDRVRAIPDVAAVSGIDLPFHQDWQKTPITRAEDGNGERSYLEDVFARAITPEYFRMHGIRILAGRSFAPLDAEGARPVAIVSRTLAERLWPDRDALGRELRAGRADSWEPWLTVVGVAADVRRVPHEPPTATLYRPVRQQTPSWLYLMMRTRTAEPAGLAASVRQAVWAEDSRQPVEGPWVIAGWVREMTGLLRFTALIGLTLASLGVLLALTGVYGLTADLSRRAMREIGIRGVGCDKGGRCPTLPVTCGPPRCLFGSGPWGSNASRRGLCWRACHSQAAAGPRGAATPATPATTCPSANSDSLTRRRAASRNRAGGGRDRDPLEPSEVHPGGSNPIVAAPPGVRPAPWVDFTRRRGLR